MLYTDMVHELNTVVMGNNFSPISGFPQLSVCCHCRL